jgi:hypothetical protein
LLEKRPSQSQRKMKLSLLRAFIEQGCDPP